MPGLKLIKTNIEAAIRRGARGQLITSTYQNFTDIDDKIIAKAGELKDKAEEFLK